MAVFETADEKHFEDHVETVTNIVTIDNIRVLGLSVEDAEFYTNFSADRKKKLLRKFRCWRSFTSSPISTAQTLEMQRSKDLSKTSG